MPLILPAAACAVLLLAGHGKYEDGKYEYGKHDDVIYQDARQVPAAQDDTAKKKPKQEKKDKKAKKEKKEKKKDAEQSYPQFRFDDHPSIYFAKGTHLDFRARVQEDVQRSDASTASAGDNAIIDLAKREVGVSGEIANSVEFQVERALTATEPWRDVYADVKRYDAIRVRAGKFKLPFSLDESTGTRARDFIYRSLAATHLAPGRDRGVMVHGRLLKRLIGYEAGVFDHDGRNARTHNPDKVFGGQTTAVRVIIEPIHDTKHTLGDFRVGVAMTQSDVPEGIGGVRGQTVLQQNFFSAGNYIVNGRRRRLGIEMQLRQGPASVKSEWMRLETERRGESVEDSDLPPLVGEGWYVSGSVALTGDRKAAGLERPAKPIFQGGAGAIEIAARVESLEFKSNGGETPSRSPRAASVLGNRDQVTTVGVNWYLNRWIKIQGNLIREKLDDPAQGPLPAKASFTSKVVRFIVSL